MQEHDIAKQWDKLVGSVKIPLVGKYGIGKFAIVDGDYDGEYFSTFRWQLNKAGYVYTSDSKVRSEKNNVYLHHLVCQRKAGKWLTHLNGDKLDNRTINIGNVQPQETMQGRTMVNATYTNKTGFRGVYNRPSKVNYMVNFRKKAYYGFKTAEDAARYYDDLAYSTYGEKAILNFPKKDSDNSN